jgi:two-component system sensor histidine kinase RegB
MGLGLFLARNVVERLGGSLQIQSVPGKGTTVVVELPLRR